MRIVANSLNGIYPRDLVEIVRAHKSKLLHIDLAVAYVSKMDEIFELAELANVPLRLFALADGKFPNVDVARHVIEHRRLSWQLFLTRDFFHPKIMWFRGVGVYIGSANLSDKAWNRNSECGIWMDAGELEGAGWDIELEAIFTSILERSTAAGLEEIKALEELARRRTAAGLDKRDRGFEADCDELLGNIRGKQAPSDVTKVNLPGGAARAAFMAEWVSSLTILRKMRILFEGRKDAWPKWVDPTTHPAIVQDQATEWWWNNTFRETGESEAVMQRVHRENAANPDVAVNNVMEAWLGFREGGPGTNWYKFMNENPRRLHEMLSETSLSELTQVGLSEVLYRCHASKAHARQIRNSEYGLGPDEFRTEEQRCEMMAGKLWHHQTNAGRNVTDLLRFVIWGDRNGLAPGSVCASRIWSAARDEEWRMPHLGVNILGELIGYARPDEYPPRNNRVSKTLYALGFDGVAFG